MFTKLLFSEIFNLNLISDLFYLDKSFRYILDRFSVNKYLSLISDSINTGGFSNA